MLTITVTKHFYYNYSTLCADYQKKKCFFSNNEINKILRDIVDFYEGLKDFRSCYGLLTLKDIYQNSNQEVIFGGLTERSRLICESLFTDAEIIQNIGDVVFALMNLYYKKDQYYTNELIGCVESCQNKTTITFSELRKNIPSINQSIFKVILR